jgi:ketosteroid isomerase-like protein
VRRYLEVFPDPWEWVRSEVREIVEVDDETVFVGTHVHVRWKESRAETEMEVFDVLTFRDGQIVLRRTWPARAPAAAAAGIQGRVPR